VGPRAGLDAVVNGKIPILCRDSIIPIIQPTVQRCTTELSWFLLKNGLQSYFIFAVNQTSLTIRIMYFPHSLHLLYHFISNFRLAVRPTMQWEKIGWKQFIVSFVCWVSDVCYQHQDTRRCRNFCKVNAFSVLGFNKSSYVIDFMYKYFLKYLFISLCSRLSVLTLCTYLRSY
jgi:hypothetical protein